MGKKNKNKKKGSQLNKNNSEFNVSETLPSSSFSDSDPTITNHSSKHIEETVLTTKDIMMVSSTSEEALISVPLTSFGLETRTEENESFVGIEQPKTLPHELAKPSQIPLSTFLTPSLDSKPIKSILKSNPNSKSLAITEKATVVLKSPERSSLEKISDFERSLEKKRISDPPPIQSTEPTSETDKFQQREQKTLSTPISTFVPPVSKIPVLENSNLQREALSPTIRFPVYDTSYNVSTRYDSTPIGNASPPFVVSEQVEVSTEDVCENSLPGTWLSSVLQLNYSSIDTDIEVPTSNDPPIDEGGALTPTPSSNYLPTRPPPPPPSPSPLRPPCSLPPSLSTITDHTLSSITASSNSLENVLGGYTLVQSQTKSKMSMLIKDQISVPFHRVLWNAWSKKKD